MGHLTDRGGSGTGTFDTGSWRCTRPDRWRELSRAIISLASKLQLRYCDSRQQCVVEVAKAKILWGAPSCYIGQSLPYTWLH